MEPLKPQALLFVDDDKSMFAGIKDLLAPDYIVSTAADGKQALVQLESHPEIGLVVTDVSMPGLSGFDLLLEIKKRFADRKRVILVTGYGSISDACEAIRLGAEDYLVKPVDGKMLRAVLHRISRSSLAERTGKEEHFGMLGRSGALNEAWALIEKYAAGDANVLIEGETGTGKELAANAMHRLSGRSRKKLVKINCAAVPDSLLESELFGHERGAFTGAYSRRHGLFEEADGGILFLDEIGEMSAMMQVKLLRVLQEGEFQRVGGNKTIKVDVRIFSASNIPVQQLVTEDRFRQDLLFRLNTLQLLMPLLREREGDIEVLAGAFLNELAGRYKCPAPELSRQLLERLTAYPWPGNIRELHNALERAFVLALDQAKFQLSHFTFLQSGLPGDYSLEGKNSLEEVEKVHIKYILDQNKGNKSVASQVLGISRDTLYRKIKRYNL
ncbi:sigma-54-dependent transcriptional regulator [Planctomycetota bacterium]